MTGPQLIEFEEQDLILPCQWHDLIHRPSEAPGELKLMAAILEDAVRCWSGQVMGTGSEGGTTPEEIARWLASKRKRARAEAEWWLFEDIEHPPFFSFRYICEAFGLNPDCIRKRLREWKEQGSAKLPRRRIRDVQGEQRQIGESRFKEEME